MSSALFAGQAERTRSQVTPGAASARTLYHELIANDGATGSADAAPAFLARELDAAAAMPCDLPDDPRDLHAWAAPRHAAIAALYADYLAERRAGAPRRYFSCMAHALYFLRCVAPTKLVDGAWLYAP